MKLFLITRPEGNCGHDEYREAVVAAHDEGEACRMHPSGDAEKWNESYWDRSWEVDHTTVSAKEIGNATPGTGVGIVCASYSG